MSSELRKVGVSLIAEGGEQFVATMNNAAQAEKSLAQSGEQLQVVTQAEYDGLLKAGVSSEYLAQNVRVETADVKANTEALAQNTTAQEENSVAQGTNAGAVEKTAGAEDGVPVSGVEKLQIARAAGSFNR